jgi:hypothetical protein
VKWILFLVFINTAGGVTTEKLPMSDHDTCMKYLTRMGLHMGDNGKSGPKAILYSSACVSIPTD